MAGDDIRTFSLRAHDHSQAYESPVSAASIDHGGLAGLTDDDHTQYLLDKASGGVASEVPTHTHADAANAGTVAHSALTGIGASDHHARYADSEAVDAIEAVGLATPVSTDTMVFSDAGVLQRVALSGLTHSILTGLGGRYTDGEADARIALAVLDDLADVTETTITTGDLLRWNGSAWVNYADSNYEPALSEGTVFPGGPSSGDKYYRTDVRGGLLFRYDGTRWVSDQLFTVNTTDDEPGSTAATNKRIVLPDDYDVYLVCWDLNHRSDNGTPESITVDLATLDEAGGSATLDTWTATPAVASRWYSTTRTLGDFVTSSTGDDTTMRIQKSSTASASSYAAVTIHYRLVAT